MKLKKYLSKNHYKYLIFDFDYTLFKLNLPWDHWLNKGVEKKLQKTDPKIIQDYKQKKLNLSQLGNKYISKYGKKAKKIILQNSVQFETNNLKGYKKNQKLIDFIKKNKNNYKFFLWTGNTTPTVKPILKKHNLLKIFKKIVTRLDSDLTKPNPEGFELIYQKGANKKDYLMIGDSLNDKGAAKKAGIDFFKITYFAKNNKGAMHSSPSAQQK